MQRLRPTVFVVDSDSFARATLESVIRQADWIPVMLESAADFLSHPPVSGPSCLVVEIVASDIDAFGLVARIGADRKQVPFIVMSTGADIPLTVRAMKAGASEFLLKPLANETLLASMRNALSLSEQRLQTEADLTVLRNRYATLSIREREVMTWVVAGLLNKQVGAELGISEITVKAHRGRAMHKMGADSLASLVAMALQLQLPPAPPRTQSRLRPRLSFQAGEANQLAGVAI